MDNVTKKIEFIEKQMKRKGGALVNGKWQRQHVSYEDKREALRDKFTNGRYSKVNQQLAQAYERKKNFDKEMQNKKQGYISKTISYIKLFKVRYRKRKKAIITQIDNLSEKKAIIDAYIRRPLINQKIRTSLREFQVSNTRKDKRFNRLVKVHNGLSLYLKKQEEMKFEQGVRDLNKSRDKETIMLTQELVKSRKRSL